MSPVYCGGTVFSLVGVVLDVQARVVDAVAVSSSLCFDESHASLGKGMLRSIIIIVAFERSA